MMQISHYILLADLFDYPRAGFSERVSKVQGFLDESCPEAGRTLSPFTDYAKRATLIETEELYTRSFDVQAMTTLDLGYVLFGDDYKRGEILCQLNREIGRAGVNPGVELADHLPNVLRLLPRLKDEALVSELVAEIIVPALTLMLAEFNPARLEQKNRLYVKHYKTLIATSDQYALLYEKPLSTLLQVLRHDFEWKERGVKLPGSDFLKSLDKEMEIENEHAE